MSENYEAWARFGLICGIISPLVTLAWQPTQIAAYKSLWRNWGSRPQTEKLVLAINVTMFMANILLWAINWQPCLSEEEWPGYAKDGKRLPYNTSLCSLYHITMDKWKFINAWLLIWMLSSMALLSLFITSKWRALGAFVPYHPVPWWFFRIVLPGLTIAVMIMKIVEVMANVPNYYAGQLLGLLFAVYPIIDILLCVAIMWSAYKSVIALRVSTNGSNATQLGVNANDGDKSYATSRPMSMAAPSIADSSAPSSEKPSRFSLPIFHRKTAARRRSVSSSVDPELQPIKVLFRNSIFVVLGMALVELTVLLLTFFNTKDENLTGNMSAFLMLAFSFHVGFVNYMLPRFTKSVWAKKSKVKAMSGVAQPTNANGTRSHAAAIKSMTKVTVRQESIVASRLDV